MSCKSYSRGEEGEVFKGVEARAGGAGRLQRRGERGGQFNLCAETINPLREEIRWLCGRNGSVHHVYPVCRTTDEGRAKVSMGGAP